jgi:hypothetical protein
MKQEKQSQVTVSCIGVQNPFDSTSAIRLLRHIGLMQPNDTATTSAPGMTAMNQDQEIVAFFTV